MQTITHKIKSNSNMANIPTMIARDVSIGNGHVDCAVVAGAAVDDAII